MKGVSKSELKAKMIQHFRSVESSGEELIVTDYGVPVLKIIPLVSKKSLAQVFSELQGRVKIGRHIALQPLSEESGGRINVGHVSLASPKGSRTREHFSLTAQLRRI